MNQDGVKTGAGTALGVDSLTQAEQAFLDQTDPDGSPLYKDHIPGADSAQVALVSQRRCCSATSG